jgi:DNA-binding CsgD family transcriptional regulator
MFHIVLALYILCLSLGVSLIILAFLSYKRFGAATYRHFALLFISATLLLFVEAMELYQSAILHISTFAFVCVSFVLSLCANGVMTHMISLLSHEIAGLRVSRRRAIVHACLTVCLAALGGLKELEHPHDPILWNANYLALFGVNVYGAFVLLRNVGRIEHPLVKSLIRSFLALFAAFVPLGVAQLVVQNFPSAPEIVHDYPVEQILYYLGVVILMLVYAVKYLFTPVSITLPALSGEFLARYLISPRESEIILMMVQGHSNKAIGDKLFISPVTVKNHIYHIYQKTGIRNKVPFFPQVNLPISNRP